MKQQIQEKTKNSVEKWEKELLKPSIPCFLSEILIKNSLNVSNKTVGAINIRIR